MTDRHMVAYGLMALIAIAVAGLVCWRSYHSHRRTYARQRDRQRKDELLQEQARGE